MSSPKRTFQLESFKSFPHVFVKGRGRRQQFYVKSHCKKTFFDERTFKKGNELYRQVDPERSKLFAGIAKQLSQIGFKQDSSVLYLGASHGYTVSFLSDMVCDGCIYALDFAPRVVRDLIVVCEQLDNTAPLMADACQPKQFKEDIPSQGVDVVFMDIAQRGQADIFIKNCDSFLKKGGFGLLALKARSEDVTSKPKRVFGQVRSQLEQVFNVVDYRELAPFEKDHAIFVVKKR
ncbi:MAG: fibrillarin-like rRNA/tRNA 2'-O-methyltransferase [Nanobdellota archaeon]